jgi:hopanoid biosynthesis associated RND transporter like protein HpnN
MASGIEARLRSNDAAAAEQAERLAAGLVAALSNADKYESPWPRMRSPVADAASVRIADAGNVGHGRGLLLLRLAPGEESFARGSAAIDALRELIAGVQDRHEGIQIGLTGLPVLENDEMRSSSRSMFWASLLSFVGVAALFILGFGGLRHALVANLVLLIGMAWAFGYTTLAVGHLNILSVSFAVTLIGIGIDYGIHYVSRYLQLRRDGQNAHDALLAASRGVGPAIVTGAITTAIAFFSAAMTSFTGIAELGLIAGGGLLLCAAAMLLVLPAALLILDRAGWDARLPQPWLVHRWVAPLTNRPRRTLAITLAATLLVACGLSGLTYDPNLLNLQDEDLQSVRLQRRLESELKQSSWYAVSAADNREELLARKDRLLALSSVERVEEIVSLLPPEDPARQPMVDRIASRLENLPAQSPAIGVDHPADVGRALERISRLVGPSCVKPIERARDLLRRLPDGHCYESLSRFQQQAAEDLLSRLRLLKSMASPQPPALADLPPALVSRFVGENQRHLLKIYGRGDLWGMPNLSHFVAEVRSVDPRATGHPLLAYEASREMKHSYEQAALYALALILTVLILDLRDAGLALLAIAPLALGMAQMFGLLGLLEIPLNPANLIALPLILGIGIDYGVHIVHEYAATTGRYRLSASTAVAVLIDALTTIVGFGSLLIATHRGLASLGLVLSLGVACCLFTSLVMLPALLGWLSRGRKEEAPSPAVPQPHATWSGDPQWHVRPRASNCS